MNIHRVKYVIVVQQTLISKTEEGAQYANQKLEEDYPDSYNGISDEYMEENY